MRARKASVSSADVRSPRVIRRPASAMLSVVSSADAGLLIGAEHVRGFGGPSPMAGDALHQFQQSDIALVQVLYVFGRERQPAGCGTRAKFLQRRWWCLGVRHVAPFRPGHASDMPPDSAVRHKLGLGLAYEV